MAQSLADKLRHHRKVMELALELRVTPREAEAILQQRAARARWEEANRRLQARMNAQSAPRTEFERPAPWYQQGSMA